MLQGKKKLIEIKEKKEENLSSTLLKAAFAVVPTDTICGRSLS
jgi:hypothetical protein